jgi:hypothetical protein
MLGSRRSSRRSVKRLSDERYQARAHLGPPRELAVRRREGPRHRAWRILWSLATIVFGVIALILTGVGARHDRHGLGPWIAEMIVVGAAVAIGLLEFKPVARGRFMLTFALAWTAAMALVIWS